MSTDRNKQRTNRRKWEEALKSDDYEQGIGSLYVPPWKSGGLQIGRKFCCLGVAGVVLGLRLNDIKGKPLLSDHEAEKVGLNHDQQKVLARLNDNHTSFATIADRIHGMRYHDV